MKTKSSVDLTDGAQHRDFVYAGDLVAVYRKVLQTDMPGYVNIPVGTGVSPTIREVAEYMRRITKSGTELRFGAIPKRKNELDSICDCTVMKRCGLNCPTGWREGMLRCFGGVED